MSTFSCVSPGSGRWRGVACGEGEGGDGDEDGAEGEEEERGGVNDGCLYLSMMG